MRTPAVTLALFATPILIVAGCAEEASEEAAPTTTPPTTTTAPAPALTAAINNAEGVHVADVSVDFSDGYATVTVETVGDNVLEPGFHDMHIHEVGVCDPANGFASAGEHFQAPGHTGMPASGDLPPLLVRSNGQGKLVATTDAFTEDQLKGPQGASIILHRGSHVVMADGEAAVPIACGVLSPASSVPAPPPVTTVLTPPATTVTETPTTTSAPETTTEETPTTTTETTETTPTTPPETTTTTSEPPPPPEELLPAER